MLLCNKSCYVINPSPWEFMSWDEIEKRPEKKETTPDLLTSEDPGSYNPGTHWKRMPCWNPT